MHTDSPQPEASAPTGPTEPEPTLFERLRAAPVTTLLFVVCIVVFILAEAKGSTERAETLIEFGATWRDGVDAEALIPLEASGADNARWLADLHRRVGHPERAVQVLMAASQRASNDIALEADLIFALEATGKPDQREQAHRMGDLLALKSPHSAEGLGFRARQLIRAGRLEAALEPMTLAARDRSDLFADELAALVDTLDRTRAD